MLSDTHEPTQPLTCCLALAVADAGSFATGAPSLGESLAGSVEEMTSTDPAGDKSWFAFASSATGCKLSAPSAVTRYAKISALLEVNVDGD